MARSGQPAASLPGDSLRWAQANDPDRIDVCRLPECKQQLTLQAQAKPRRFCSDGHRALFSRRRAQVSDAVDAALRMDGANVPQAEARRLVARVRWLLELRAVYANGQDALRLSGATVDEDGEARLFTPDTRVCPKCSGEGRLLRVETPEEVTARQITEDPSLVERRRRMRNLLDVINHPDTRPLTRMACLAELEELREASGETATSDKGSGN